MLDLLLGNQKWRTMFLSGDKINQIIKSNDSLGKDKKGNYEYLLAKRLNNLKHKKFLIGSPFRRQDINRGRRRRRGGGGGGGLRFRGAQGARGPVANFQNVNFAMQVAPMMKNLVIIIIF